jgi:Cof subfamily protein (haloacid dehalogenase superfamily)
MNKFYVSDLDGTLLNRESRLSIATERMLQQLLMDGLQFTIATLRSVASVKPIFQNVALKLPVIELNGAFITDLNTGEKLEVRPLDAAVRLSLYRALKESGLSPIILTHNDGVDTLCFGEIANPGIERYYTSRITHGDPRVSRYTNASELASQRWVGLTVIEERDILADCRNRLEWMFNESINLNLTESIETPELVWMTVSAPEASKAHAIKSLQERFGLQEHAVVSFGDQLIDIPMFQISDLAVAVENAPEEVKSAAGHIIGPHDSDAVAKYLYADYYGESSVPLSSS